MNTVLFDPGYSKHVSSFLYFNEQVKKTLSSLKSPQQKSFKYRQLLPQILNVMQREVGFYYGCLLWATYIKCNFKDNPKEIDGNSFYGRTEAELEKYAYLSEVNSLLTFFKQYPKNLSFYRINGSKIDEKYIKTVEIYKEFLILNKSFINTKTTSDIKLPKKIYLPLNEDLPKIKVVIDSTVNDGNFERLFDFKIF